MSRLNTLAEEFSQEVRSRGTEYFVRGAVRITDAKPGHVAALVNGSRQYKVETDFADNEFANECSCPYYEQWGECKHIWATVLQAQREGLLGNGQVESENSDEVVAAPADETEA